jgi:hypothetical protein
VTAPWAGYLKAPCVARRHSGNIARGIFEG